MQLARVIRELEGARGEGERMLRRMRVLEGREQVMDHMIGGVEGCLSLSTCHWSVRAKTHLPRSCGRRRRRPCWSGTGCRPPRSVGYLIF